MPAPKALALWLPAGTQARVATARQPARRPRFVGRGGAPGRGTRGAAPFLAKQRPTLLAEHIEPLLSVGSWHFHLFTIADRRPSN